MVGLNRVVATAPSLLIQKTSTALLSLVTAAIGELSRAAPGGAMAKPLSQLPPLTAGLAKVVLIAPSGAIQNTSRAPANLVNAAIGESARAAPGGVIANGSY